MCRSFICSIASSHLVCYIWHGPQVYAVERERGGFEAEDRTDRTMRARRKSSVRINEQAKSSKNVQVAESDSCQESEGSATDSDLM